MVHEDARLLADLTKTMRQTLESMRENLAAETKRTINMSTFAACSGYQPLIEFETDVVNRGLDLVVALEAEMKQQDCPVRTSELFSQWWLLHQRLLLAFAGVCLFISGCVVKRALANSFLPSCWRRDRSAGGSYGAVGFTKRNVAKNQRKVTWAAVLSSARSPASSRRSPSSPRRGSPSLSPWTSPEPDHSLPAREPPTLPEPASSSITTWAVSLPSTSPQSSPVFGFFIQQPEARPPSPPLACERASSQGCLTSPSFTGRQLVTLSPLTGPMTMTAPVTMTMTMTVSPRAADASSG